MDSQITTIVFDFGGVIKLNTDGNINADIARLIGVSAEEFKKEYFKHNHLSNVKDLPWEEMIMEVVQRFADQDLYKEKILERIELYRTSSTWNNELLSLVKKLKQNNYKTAIFSNNTSSLREEVKKTDFYDLFDEIVVSAEIGYQKPQPEAFECLFKELEVQPEQVIFIDDTPRSLEGAETIGYKPVLYIDNNQLRRDLELLGVNLD